MSRHDRDPNRGNRKIPLSFHSAADAMGLNDDEPVTAAQFTDRSDADDAAWQKETGRLDRLTVADVGADVALQRVLDLADRWAEDAARADDAEPATREDLSRMIAASRWSRQHAVELRAAVAGTG